MTVKVYVNRHVIEANAKSGEKNPPLVIRKGRKSVQYANQVALIGSSTVVYRPDAPLAYGPRVWIECDDAVRVA